MTTSWFELGVGVYLMVSPWLLGASGNPLMLWSNTLVGLGIVIVRLWAMFDRIPEPPPEEKGRSEDISH